MHRGSGILNPPGQVNPVTTFDAQAEAIDQALVDRVIASLPKPKSFVSYWTRFAPDTTGDEATWVFVRVNDKQAIASKSSFSSIREFADNIRQSLLEAGMSKWPYVMLVSADQSGVGSGDKDSSRTSKSAPTKARKKVAKKVAKKASRKAAKKKVR